MACHAESLHTMGPSHWHILQPSSPQQTKSVVDMAGLEHRRVETTPIFTRSSSGWLRHTSSMPAGAANVNINSGTRPTVVAGSRARSTSEPLRRSPVGITRGDSGEAQPAIGKPSLVHQVSTAPKTSSDSSVEPGSSLGSARPKTLTLSPSAGSMQIALVPRLSHQPTPIPAQHANTTIPHKSVLRHTKSPSLPSLTILIPSKQSNGYENTVIDMATSRGSPPPRKSTSRPGEKRVSFSKDVPEIIPSVPSKRRQSSVNQRPSWSSVFLLRDPKPRDDVAARSRSLSPGPSILKEHSAFKSNASDAELKQDEDGVERKVHISPLWEKNLKRLPRGRQAKKNALPIPQAKVSRNASSRALSPEDGDVSPTGLSPRHASPREDTFEKSTTEHHAIVVHPPSPPESDAEDDEEEVFEDSDESPQHSRQSSLDDIDAIDNRFSKCDIDGSSHAQRHEKRKDSADEPKGSQEWRESRKSSYGSRKSSTASRKDSTESAKEQKPPPQRRRSSSADQAEMWLRKSSIYGVRSRTPRLPTRLPGVMRA